MSDEDDPLAGSPTSDPRRIKRASERQKLRKQQDEEVVRKLLGQRDGRAWLWSVIGFCGVFRAIPPGEAMAVGQMLGQRNIGLMLWSQLESVDPELTVRMMRENSGLADG